MGQIVYKHSITKDRYPKPGTPERRFPWLAECGFCGVTSRRPSHKSAVTLLNIHVATRHPEQYRRYTKEVTK